MERQKKRERERRERMKINVFHLLVHFPNIAVCWAELGWSQEPGTSSGSPT